MEDVDRPREVAGSAARILRTLEAFGFEWDGEVMAQSTRTTQYEDALDRLRQRGVTFQCSCSRMTLADEDRYPGTCREHPADPRLATSTRLRVDAGRVQFTDRIQGTYRQDVAATIGDLILKRRDQLFAYLLAVVVDDAAQGVTHVVRGADLLDNTPRQIYLQRQLGLALPSYAHLAVLTEPDGGKLSKSARSVRLEETQALGQLISVFQLLGLSPHRSLSGATITSAWDWAVAAWDINRVYKGLRLILTP